MMRYRYAHLIVLTGILALSLFLRLYQLGQKPVWYDEACSVSSAEKPLVDYAVSERVNYKPVFYFMLHGWIKLFGEGAFALRLFSALWGFLAVVLIYRLASFLFDRRTGYLSAFLLGISVFHVFHSQQVRHFSFIVFLGMACIYGLVRFYKEAKPLSLYLLGAGNILLLFTHPFSLSLIVVELAFVAVYFRKDMLRRWFFAQSVPALFLLVWFLMPNKEHLIDMAWWIATPGAGSLLETFHTLSWGGARYGLDDCYVRPFAGSYLLSAGTILLLLNGLRSRPRLEEAAFRFLLLAWLLVPILLAFIWSRATQPSVYAIKHLIIVLPAFCILAARGISLFNKAQATAAVCSVFLLNAVPLKAMYDHSRCPDWKSSTQFVKDGIRPGDTVIVSSLSEIVPFMYYFNERKPSLEGIDILGKTQGAGYSKIFTANRDHLVAGITQTRFFDKDISGVKEFMDFFSTHSSVKRGRVWVMVSRWTSPETTPAMDEFLRAHFTKKKDRQFEGVHVAQYDPLPSNAGGPA